MLPNNPLPDRRSLRLPEYDYAQDGGYYVTLCTLNRVSLFGSVDRDEMNMNSLGYIVDACWRWLAEKYSYVELDQWVVMPNHLHGVIVIRAGDSRVAPTQKPKPLGQLIGAFKTISTQCLGILRGAKGDPIWQRNFYEHVIRTETDLNRIREYIINNPLRWAEDQENPVNWK